MLVYISITNPETRRAFVVQGDGKDISELIEEHDVNESYFFMNFMQTPFYPCELSPHCKVFISLDSFAFLCDNDEAESVEFLNNLCETSKLAQPELVTITEFDKCREIPDTDNLDYIRKLHDHHCSFRSQSEDE